MRRNPKTGELSGYYRLVESYRDINGRVCHRTMVTAGFLDELNSDHLNQIQNGLNLRVEGLDNQLFPGNTDPLASAYIDRFYRQMVKEKRIDVLPKPASNKDWQIIDLNSLRNKDVREIGAEWLCYQAISQLRIDKFLESKGGVGENIIGLNPYDQPGRLSGI